ncbi:HNH endonuclease signature motif containing protein [Rhodococcoides fascians]|uniref:HNH endonuclease signature motif containing protein n=1 Tax=Rhodococcoides fascians TaxID=1828 RepID=UPI0036705E00
MYVRHRDRAGTYDRHCRFPGCHRPAARCQIDHVIPFDHANPLGGWTTVNNLQCLCEYHHSVKTAGYTSPPNPDDPASSPTPTHPTTGTRTERRGSRHSTTVLVVPRIPCLEYRDCSDELWCRRLVDHEPTAVVSGGIEGLSRR